MVGSGAGNAAADRVLSIVNTPKLYAGVLISVIGLALMWGEAAIPWFFHLAIVCFVWGGVLIGMALRGQ